MKFESKKLVTKLVLALFMLVACVTFAFAEQTPDDFSGHAYCTRDDIDECIAGFYFKEDGRCFMITDKLHSIGEVLKVLTKKNVSEADITKLGISCYGVVKWSQDKAKKELTLIPSDGSQEGVVSYTISSDGKILSIEGTALDRYY
ncbi:MAG: hypothetical protein IJ207_06540 [Treponema sp.]|uniref:hypothetical protein n=1 Tax=Treponema sp. TaxID=166 RepID=UPI0025F683A7|nr:hypothetical protein [Treponema sp.]MBQ9281842.1 hypothetical protein [Treponema sp.]MBR1722226.1 hypothetical protein [Treponema sp.]